ncbi:MAG: hypothetical protein V2B18_04040 [Pseudomonadota bacterium]
MKCGRCQSGIMEGESHEHGGRTLCDDCYMDALSPVRTCDPWAVHSAKRLEACGSQGLLINETQERIIRFLGEAGDAEPEVVCRELGLDPDLLHREIAALRHAEKVRGRLQDGRKVLCLW